MPLVQMTSQELWLHKLNDVSNDDEIVSISDEWSVETQSHYIHILAIPPHPTPGAINLLALEFVRLWLILLFLFLSSSYLENMSTFELWLSYRN